MPPCYNGGMVFPSKLSEEWVPVAKVGGLNARMDAEMLQSYLLSQGLTPRLFNDNTAGWMPVYAVFIPIRVCVPPEQVDAARSLLADREWDEPDDGGDGADLADWGEAGIDGPHEQAGDVACPQCGARRLEHGKASLLFSFLSLFLLAIPLLIRWSAWQCPDCGWQGRSSDLY